MWTRRKFYRPAPGAAGSSRPGRRFAAAAAGETPRMASLRDKLARLEPAGEESDGEEVPRLLIWVLALGAFGLAWALTTVSAYLPPLLQRFTHSRVLIGGIIAAEGLFAIAVPLVVGPWSDRTWTRFGRRRTFMLAALPALVAALAAVALPGSLLAVALVLGAFYVAYYVFEPPYRSLYADRLADEVQGRASGAQHILRGAALGGALILGGLLFGAWKPLPFLLAAAILAAAGGAVVRFVREAREDEPGESAYTAPFRIVREHKQIRRFLYANTAWEFTFAGMRTFVVLYVTQGLGEPVYVSTAVLAAVALGYLVAAVFVGRLGDRFGSARVILFASFVYGGGLCAAGIASSWHWAYLAAIALVSVAAGAVMTLAWPLLFTLMPDDEHEQGATTGLATLTKGLGIVLGPAVVGAAIDAAGGWLKETDGYQIMWPTVGVPVLAVIPIVLMLSRRERRQRRAEER